MTAHEALQSMNAEYNELLERFNLTGGFGNWYIIVKNALNELEELKKTLIQKASNEIEKNIKKAKDLQRKYGEAGMDDYFTHSSGRILGLEQAKLILENLPF